jgi:ribosome-binding protein aMBF1 (putative translation factor)
MSDEKFLRLIHAIMGYRKLDGFQYKNLARKLHISKQLLSQYLQGDVRMPDTIRDKIDEILGVEHIIQQYTRARQESLKMIQNNEKPEGYELSETNRSS